MKTLNDFKDEVKSLDDDLAEKIPGISHMVTVIKTVPDALAMLGIDQEYGLMGLQMLILGFQSDMSVEERAEFQKKAQNNIDLFVANEKVVTRLMEEADKMQALQALSESEEDEENLKIVLH